MCILVLFFAHLICPVFFIYFPQCSLNTYSLAQKAGSKSLSTFLSIDLESPVFQGILDPAGGKWYLETKSRVLGVLIMAWM